MAETRIIITDTDLADGLINIRLESDPPMPNKAEDMTPGQHYAQSVVSDIAEDLLENKKNTSQTDVLN